MAATAAVGTTNFTHVKKYAKSSTSVISFVDKLEKDLIKLIEGSLSITTDNEYIDLSSSDMLHLLKIKDVSGIEKCIRDIFLESTLKLNKKSGISGLISALVAVKLIKAGSKRISHGLAKMSIIDDLTVLSSMSRHVKFKDISKTINTYLHDPRMSSMITQAYSLAGHSGQIFVDKEYSSASCVELLSGYTFPYGMVPEFAMATKSKIWKDTNVKCVIIDGKIESVSEIHHILQYFFEDKWPGMIVCRGYGEEVLGTLIKNYNRGTLNVIPIIVPYDLEGVNALVDIATTCNSDVVSSLKGELISSIDTSEIATVERLTVSNKMIISNPSADHNVRHHLSNILEQKDSTGLSDKKDLFDKRAKALSSVCARIKIDSHQKNRGLCFSRLDHGIKLFKEMVGYGAVNLEVSVNSIENIVLLETLNVFLENGYTHLPAYSLILGCTMGEEIADNILSSGTYLLLDN